MTLYASKAVSQKAKHCNPVHLTPLPKCQLAPRTVAVAALLALLIDIFKIHTADRQEVTYRHIPASHIQSPASTLRRSVWQCYISALVWRPEPCPAATHPKSQIARLAFESWLLKSKFSGFMSMTTHQSLFSAPLVVNLSNLDVLYCWHGDTQVR